MSYQRMGSRHIIMKIFRQSQSFLKNMFVSKTIWPKYFSNSPHFIVEIWSYKVSTPAAVSLQSQHIFPPTEASGGSFRVKLMLNLKPVWNTRLYSERISLDICLLHRHGADCENRELSSLKLGLLCGSWNIKWESPDDFQK